MYYENSLRRKFGRPLFWHYTGKSCGLLTRCTFRGKIAFIIDVHYTTIALEDKTIIREKS